MSASCGMAPLEEVCLNALSLSSHSALFIDIQIQNIKNIHTLIDSGASNNFMDSHFAIDNGFALQNLQNPIRLTLFDGSAASHGLIQQFCTLDVDFPCGAQHSIHFLLTPLDRSASVVLGFTWLIRHNPSIDWIQHKITFLTTVTGPPPVNPSRSTSRRASFGQSTSAPLPSSTGSPLASPPLESLPTASLHAATAQIPISFISKPAIRLLSHLPPSHHSSIIYSSFIKPSSIPTHAASSQLDLSHHEYEALHQAVPIAYHNYLDIFSKSKGTTLPPRCSYDHKIELEGGTTPPFRPIYSLSEVKQFALCQFIDENLANHFICPSQSPSGAPILFIKKKDRSLRLAVDYHGLNHITKKDQYPLLLIPDLLDCLRSACIFTKIDLRGAYNLVCIAEGDEWKTAFRTHYSSYEFQVMHYRLTNAPASFQQFMNDCFKDLLDVCIVVYLDDILIYSENLDKHATHIREVLRRLRTNSLFAKLEKCEFDVDTTSFLGFIISPEGLKMDDAKVQIIRDWLTPWKVKDVQSFLGFANFYRRFITNYSDMSVPLTRLMCKSTRWDWTPECQDTFSLLKDAFTRAPVLHHFDPTLPLVVETDASNYAIAGILSLQTDDGDIHPVAFYSRTLHSAELNYDMHDKELLAIFEAFKIWRHYLESLVHTIDVVTDHKNLEYFATTKSLSHRQVCWSEYLAAFNMVVRFRPGKLSEKPDSLTRRFDLYLKGEDRDFTLANPQNLRPVFSQEQLSISLHATHLREVARDTVSLMDTSIPILNAAALMEDILAGLHSDPLSKREIDRLSQGLPSPRFSLSPTSLLLMDRRVFVPDYRPTRGSLCTRILQSKHDHLMASHFGFNKTLTLLHREYVWPTIRSDCKRFVKQCVLCARNKLNRHRPYRLLQPLPIPERPWHSISMDFIEQLPVSDGFTAILVVIDRLMKESVFIPTHNTATTSNVADAFVTHVFSKHGIPLHVSSNCGSEFTSHFFRSLGSLLHMRLHFTSGHHPSANGQVERVNSTLEQYL